MTNQTVQGIEKMLKALEKLGVEPLESLARAGEGAMRDRVETRTKIKCPTNNGALRSSYTTQVIEKSDDEILVVTGTNKAYAPHVEYGTRPHQTSKGSSDFIESITDWAEKKGIEPYLVIRSIRKKGTRAHPHLRPAWDEGKEKVLTDIATKMKRVIKGLGK
jgi:HK97 gp10 family phage protein